MSYDYKRELEDIAASSDMIGAIKSMFVQYEQIVASAKYYYSINKAVNTMQLTEKLSGSSWKWLLLIDFLVKKEALEIVYTPSFGIDNRLYILGNNFGDRIRDQWDFVTAMKIEIADNGKTLQERKCYVLVEKNKITGGFNCYLRKEDSDGMIKAFIRDTPLDGFLAASAWANKHPRELRCRGKFVCPSDSVRYESINDFSDEEKKGKINED